MTGDQASPVRVMIVDDNPVVRSGLVSLVEASGVGEVVAEAGDGKEAVVEAERTGPDLVLLDVRMPRVDGVEAAGLLSKSAQVVMLTYTDDPEVVRSSVRNGACGYLVHGSFSPEELGRAVREAMAGANPLSPSAATALFDAVRHAPEPAEAPDPAPAGPEAARAALDLSVREAEIIERMAEGKSNAEIAAALFLSEKTVKNHLNRIYTRLAADSRTAVIARWHAATSDARPGTGAQ